VSIWVNEFFHDEEALRAMGTPAVEIGGFFALDRAPPASFGP
jgi:hypothetical protein